MSVDRHHGDDQTQAFGFGPFTLHLTARVLVRDGEVVTLGQKSFDTLVVLLRHRDRVVPKDELMRTVWPDSFVSDDSLTQSVWALRRALGEDTSRPRYIATVARRGYRFIAPVTELPGPDEHAVPDTLADVESPPADAPLAASLDRPRTPVVALAPAGDPASRSRPFLRALIPTVLVLAGLAVVLWRVNAEAPPLHPLRLAVPAPAGMRLISGGMISPDSRHVTLVAQDERTGRASLWIRALDSGETRGIGGTEGATRPFWSPDGQSIGFFAGGKLKTVGLAGEVPRTLATVGLNPAGGTWGRSGVILFAASRAGLSAVPATGGPVTAVTTLRGEHQERAHRWPEFLPDGRHFIFTVLSNRPERAGTYVASLDAPQPARVLGDGTVFATYAASGHLLFIRDRTLMAQRFAADARRLLDSPFVVTSDLSAPDFLNGAMISASAHGLLLFGRGSAGGRLVWFDRGGTRLGAIDAPAALHNPTLAPDEQSLLADTAGETNAELRGVWQIDLERGTRTRVITAGGTPIWAPGGDRIAFTSNRGGISDLYVRSASGPAEGDALLQTAENKGVNDWTRDGRYIVYLATSPSTRMDVWLLPTFGDRRPIPFLRTPFEEMQAQVSPDGRWIAYTSNESGRWEVFVQTFPMPGAKVIVSTDGGGEPQWRPDGRELFYLAADNMLMALDVSPGPTWRAGRQRPLFRLQVTGDTSTYRTRYAVSRDGQRVLVDSADDTTQEPLSMVVNWPQLAMR